MKRSLRRFSLCVAMLAIITAYSVARSASAQPSLSEASTFWPGLSIPVRHADLMDWSATLEFTREQLIAAERLHATYLDETLALRQRAIDGLTALDPHWLLVPSIPPVESDWRKMLSIRSSCHRELAQRDDLLLANLAETLAETQQASMPIVRRQRAQQRILSDGFVAPWFRGDPPLNLRALARELHLNDEQRAAIAPILEEYELKALRSLEQLAEGIDKMREQWLRIVWRDALDGEMQPDMEPFLAAMVPLRDPIRALLDDEYATMERIKGVISSDDWRRLAVMQAEAARALGAEPPPTLMSIDSIANLAEVTDDERRALVELRDHYARRYDEAAFAVSRGRRLQRLTNPILLGPSNYGRSIQNEEFIALFEESRRSDQAYGDIMREGRDALSGMFGPERWEPIRKLITEDRDRSRLQRQRDTESAAGNLVEFSWHIQPWHLSSDRPQWSLIEQAANAIGASPAQIDALREAHATLAEAVSGQTTLIEQAVNSITTRQLADDWGQRATAMHETIAHAVEAIAALDASFSESVHASLANSPAVQRAWVIELARQWEMITTGARNAPLPIPLMSSSRMVLLTSLQDRVNPVTTLLSMELDEPSLFAALAELQARTPAIAQASGSLRSLTAAAYRDVGLMQAEGRMTSGQRTREDWTRYEQIQKDAAASAVATFDARRAMLKSIGDALAAAESVMSSAEARTAFHERHGRQVCPIAWNAVTVASKMFADAEHAPGLDESQRAAVRAAATSHLSTMRDQALQVQLLVEACALVDGPRREDRCRAALQWAAFEQEMFQLDEQRDASCSLLRPLLSEGQLGAILPAGSRE